MPICITVCYLYPIFRDKSQFIENIIVIFLNCTFMYTILSTDCNTKSK